jgi:hypothetical protein
LDQKYYVNKIGCKKVPYICHHIILTTIACCVAATLHSY